MKHLQLTHQFVRYVPEVLEPGILYISIEFGTVAHSCCCGCGAEIVTPLTPTDWAITFDGETISLRPSVGNWSLPCRSHYVITRGNVVEAPPWSEKQITDERNRDRNAKAVHFGSTPMGAVPEHQPAPLQSTPESMWSRISRWVFGR